MDTQDPEHGAYDANDGHHSDSSEGSERDGLLSRQRPKSEEEEHDAAALRALAGSLGSVAMGFNWSLFGYFAVQLGALFFPHGDTAISLLKTFAVFGAAQIMRPVGGILFGWIGDRVGRVRAITISTMMTALCTAGMGCLPTYHQVGWVAPALLVALRLGQGLGVGGQFVGVALLTLELAPERHRGFFSGVCFSTSLLGTALGSAAAAIIHISYNEQEVLDWAWRVPFLVGLPVGLLGMYVMQAVSVEQPVLQQAAQKETVNPEAKSPAAHVVNSYYGSLFRVVGAVALYAVSLNIGFIWLPTFESALNMEHRLHFMTAFTINTAMMVALSSMMVLMGWVSDIVKSRTRMILTGAVMYVVAAPLALLLVGWGGVGRAIFGQLMLVIPMAVYSAPLCVFMIPLFPVEVRYSAVGIAWNLGHMAFGGSAPVIATALWRETYHAIYIGVYLSAVACLAAACVYFRAPRARHFTFSGA